MVKKREAKLYATNITWDAEEKDLPTRLEIPPSLWTRLSTDDYTEVISEYISNKSGYCHDGFDVECSMSEEEMRSAVDEICEELVKEYREGLECGVVDYAYTDELERRKDDLETAICLMEAEHQFKRTETGEEPDRA